MSGQHLAQPSPARKLLVEANQQAKSLADLVRADLLAALVKVRELSRPVRRKSPYPSKRAILDSVTHLEDVTRHAFEEYRRLKALMKELREHGRREHQRRGKGFRLKDE